MRGGKATVFEAKNCRAVSLLKSWLRASGIGFRVGEGAVDLLVTAKNGERVSVQIHAADSSPTPEGCTVIEASTLTGRNIQGALDAFCEFQKTLGYEAKCPVNRGDLPTQKLSYVDSFEDVALRHTELRRAPNPTTEDLMKWEPVMKKATWNFIRANGQLLQDHMLEFDELFGTYARCYTVNYLAWYMVPEDKATDSNNERKLYVYLWQRFSELRSLLRKKGRSTLVGLDIAAIGRGGATYDYSDRTYWSTSSSDDIEQEEEKVDEAYLTRHRELDTRNPNARRASAINLLTVKLAKLDHGAMVEILKEASENYRIHPDAQREAAKRLAEHASSCPDCMQSSEYTGAAIQEDEESGAVHACSAEE